MSRQLRLQLRRSLDKVLRTPDLPARPATGWVRAIRQALGMTQEQLGRRIGIDRKNVSALESDEVEGAVTLARLERAAAALGCDVHYRLVPRKPLEQMVADQAMVQAEKRMRRIAQTQSLEASAVAADDLQAMTRDLADEMVAGQTSDLWNDD